MFASEQISTSIFLIYHLKKLQLELLHLDFCSRNLFSTTSQPIKETLQGSLYETNPNNNTLSFFRGNPLKITIHLHQLWSPQIGSHLTTTPALSWRLSSRDRPPSLDKGIRRSWISGKVPSTPPGPWRFFGKAMKKTMEVYESRGGFWMYFLSWKKNNRFSTNKYWGTLFWKG